MLLNMRSEFFSVGLFESLDSFIVGLELLQLLFVFLDSSVETCLELLYLTFEVGALGLVILVLLLFFGEEALLVLLELL